MVLKSTGQRMKLIRTPPKKSTPSADTDIIDQVGTRSHLGSNPAEVVNIQELDLTALYSKL